MKFGKQIQEAAAQSIVAWQPYWLNYKALKKILKDLELPSGQARVETDAKTLGAPPPPPPCMRRHPTQTRLRRAELTNPALCTPSAPCGRHPPTDATFQHTIYLK